MQFSEIKHLLQEQLTFCQQIILSTCNSNLPLVNAIVTNLLNSNSKLLRPMVTLLAAALANYHDKEHLQIAAALELLHAATLLHDDVIDNSDLRRGQVSANSKWGNNIAVLAGDFLLAKSSALLADLRNVEIVTTTANATSTIVEGELLQLLHKNNLALCEKTYMKIITAKTAKLFELTAVLPTLLTTSSIEIRPALAKYGLNLGIAFQLIDDALDYQPTATKQLGKNTGQDFLEGNITLPIIYLLNHGSTAEKALIKTAFSHNHTELWPELKTIIASSGAIAYTMEYAKQAANLAKTNLQILPPSVYRDAACSLVDFVLTRNY